MTPFPDAPPAFGRGPAGTPPGARALRYDFTEPRRLAQPQLRVLQEVHVHFAQALALALSAQLRGLVDVVVAGSEMTPYADFVTASSGPGAFFVAPEAEGHGIVMEWELGTAVLVVERLFGGEGTAETAARMLSPIEEHVMRRLAERAFGALSDAWNRAAPLVLGPPRYEREAEFARLTAGPDQVVVSRFSVRALEREGVLTLCYPMRLLERLLDRAALHRWGTESEVPVAPAIREGFEATLRGLPVELRAELGRTRLRLSDLGALALGDVILLDHALDAPLTVSVRDREKFAAAAGRSGDRLAVRILQVLGEPPAAPPEPATPTP